MLKVISAKSAKSLLAVILATLVMISVFPVVTADNQVIDPNATAVYLNNSFDGKSAIVNGDIYSANGNVKFNNAGDNEVSGSIYLNTGKQFQIPKNYSPDFANRVVMLDDTPFNAPDKVFMEAPDISNYVSSFEAGWWPTPQTVTQDTHYGNLNIESTLEIDASEEDRYIVIDSISFGKSGKIEILGDKNLYLFINGNLIMNNGSNSIARNPDITDVKTHVFVNGDVNLKNSGGSIIMRTNIYVSGSNISIQTKELYGNIVSNNATKFDMPGGSNVVYGTVYTPNANAVVKSSAAISGRLVANTLTMSGKGKIEYNEAYANLAMPYIPVPEEPEEVPPVMDIPDGPSLLINFPYAYLYGNEDGTAGAEDPITREQAVALIYRLLKQDNKLGGFTDGSVAPYTNIEENRWSRTALEFGKYIGVYKTGYISAQAPVTRGEVAKIITFALKIRPDDTKTIAFMDLKISNLYYHYIKALADIGVLIGSDDGNIYPDNEMTRAEFVTMVNRMIGRGNEHEVIDSINPYSDLLDGKWYYNDVMRASFGYTDGKEDGLYRIDTNRKPPISSLDYN